MGRKSQEEIAKDVFRLLVYTQFKVPIKILAPSTPSDYDTYYHDPEGARLCKLLSGGEVERLYGDAYGLDPMRIYDDLDEVAEEIEDWLWDSTDAGCRANRPEAFDHHEWVNAYRPIAHMMAEDMPWREHIVIDCY